MLARPEYRCEMELPCGRVLLLLTAATSFACGASNETHGNIGDSGAQTSAPGDATGSDVSTVGPLDDGGAGDGSASDDGSSDGGPGERDATDSATPGDAASAPARGLLGVYNGGTTADVESFEAAVTGGKHVGATSLYPAFDSTPSKSTVVTDMLARGTAVVIDLASRTSGGVQPWADFASGKYDADATAWGAFFASLDVSKAPLYVSFNSEPDTALSNGSQTSASDFVAAYRHVHSVIGTTNIKWLWCVGNSRTDLMPSLYPGDAYVDVIGADPYKWQFHAESETPAQTFAIFTWFGTQTWHGEKPYAIPETGVDATKFASGTYTAADWWKDVPSAAQGYGLVFVLAFDREGDYSGSATPDNFLIEGTVSASGYLSALNAPYFN